MYSVIITDRNDSQNRENKTQVLVKRNYLLICTVVFGNSGMGRTFCNSLSLPLWRTFGRNRKIFCFAWQCHSKEPSVMETLLHCKGCKGSTWREKQIADVNGVYLRYITMCENFAFDSI